jgi:hypothetical protein
VGSVLRVATGALVLVAGGAAFPGGPLAEARTKRKSPVKSTEPTVKANEYRPAELAEAVRIAATPVATSASAVLGAPVCPTGVKRSPSMAAQCIVTFDRVTAAYVVAVGSSGTLVASPVFLVIPRLDLERELGRTSDAPVRCGTAPVLVVPSGSATGCDVGKRSIDAIVTRQSQGWTVSTTPSRGKKPPEVEDTLPASKSKKKKRT